MEGEQLGNGGDGMKLCGCGWSCGHQEGVDAEASEESIDIQGGSIKWVRGGGVDCVFVAVLVRKAEGGRSVVVVVGKFAL